MTTVLGQDLGGLEALDVLCDGRHRCLGKVVVWQAQSIEPEPDLQVAITWVG